ncbi:hypothetical protein BJ912DRAFT_962766 [Pholiota molesta]|nr:hypothetical protein BJ912DRAFT_962766 [Pholiota molesta]
MAKDFCDLPQELQTEVLSNLDAVSLTRCAMTCKSVYETVKSASSLVYTVQLHLDGLEDGGMLTSSSDSIETILRRRQAWRSLDGKEPLTCQTRRGYAEELAHRLELPLMGISAREFTMDPTQDLLVFLDNRFIPTSIDTYTICVHVRSLSTNTVHPQAQQSPLQFTVVPGPYWTGSGRATFQIAYNILAIYLHDAPEGTRVLIWDWTTSDLILDTAISFGRSLPALRYGFGLLDPTHFFIACASSSGSIRLYRLVQSPEATAGPTHLATLHFPPTSPGVNLLTVTNVASPIEDRVHMFKYARRALTGHLPLDVPWTDWGPQNTRFVESSSSQYATRVKRYVHGQRVVFPGRNIGVYGLSLHIFDFSLAAVLFAKGILGITGTLLAPSTISAETVPLFLEDVTTHLPCVLSRRDFEQIYETYMIYADGIVGIDMEDHRGSLLHIYPI